MKHDALLFDFGGTLDTGGVHWSERFWEIYEEFEIPVKKEEFEKAYVHAEKQMNSGIVKKEDTFRKVLGYKFRFQLEYLADPGYGIPERRAETMAEKCYDSVKAETDKSGKVLEKLAGKYRMGLVSNFYGNIETVLNEFQLKRFFDIIVDSGIENVRKPDPELWDIAIKRLGTDHGNCTVIGDSYKNDIAPAKKLGCKTVWIDVKSWTRPEDTSAADYTIGSVEELEGLLL